MQRHLVRNVFLFLMVASFAFAQQHPTKENSVAGARKAESAPMPSLLPSEETVNGFMQAMFGHDPSVTWKIVNIKPAEADSLAQVDVVLSSSNGQGQQATTFFVTSDQKHALVGELIPFGTDPFGPVRSKLEREGNGAGRGPAKAPVQIVEFSDLQCPHCKQAQPTVEKLLADEPNAHFVFQPFPLPSHDWAMKAATYAECVGEANNAAFWKFTDAVYNAQSDITSANADEKLKGLADSSGVKGTDIEACAAKPETKTRVEQSIALGRAVGVTGTPTLFIGGRKVANVNGMPYEMLKSIVEFQARQGK
jgi:protein-disulfide isomerase